MGLLDGLAGQILGSVMGGNSQGGMAAIATEVFSQSGGVSGILDKFKASGLGDHAASWVGTGANLPVSADQITSALGSGPLADMAAKFGLTPEVLSSQLAEHLPGVIDKMTPSGAVGADSGGLLSSVLGMLK